MATIQLPVLFRGLVISEMSREDFSSLNLSAGLLTVDERKCFKLEGENWHGFIVAGHVSWLENNTEYAAESALML